jgi:hypothetical protein
MDMNELLFLMSHPEWDGNDVKEERNIILNFIPLLKEVKNIIMDYFPSTIRWELLQEQYLCLSQPIHLSPPFSTEHWDKKPFKEIAWYVCVVVVIIVVHVMLANLFTFLRMVIHFLIL